jgi:hypothetical protein
MQPIVLKYANADGFTDFVTGLEPDHYVEDNLLYATPFGDIGDPLLGKAMDLIAGITPVAKKSVTPPKTFEKIPVPRKPIPEVKMDWTFEPGSLQLD